MIVPSKQTKYTPMFGPATNSHSVQEDSAVFRTPPLTNPQADEASTQEFLLAEIGSRPIRWSQRPKGGNSEWRRWKVARPEVDAAAAIEAGTFVAKVRISDTLPQRIVSSIASSQNVEIEDAVMTFIPCEDDRFLWGSYIKRIQEVLKYPMEDETGSIVLRPVELAVTYQTTPVKYPIAWKDSLDKWARIIVDWTGLVAESMTDHWFTNTTNAAFDSTPANLSLFPEFVFIPKDEKQAEEHEHSGSEEDSDNELDLDKISPNVKTREVNIQPEPEGGLPNKEALATMPVPDMLYISQYQPKTKLLEARFDAVATAYIMSKAKWFDQGSLNGKGSCNVASVSVKIEMHACTDPIQKGETEVISGDWTLRDNYRFRSQSRASQDLSAVPSGSDREQRQSDVHKSIWQDQFQNSERPLPQPPEGWTVENVKKISQDFHQACSEAGPVSEGGQTVLLPDAESPNGTEESWQLLLPSRSVTSLAGTDTPGMPSSGSFAYTMVNRLEDQARVYQEVEEEEDVKFGFNDFEMSEGSADEEEDGQRDPAASARRSADALGLPMMDTAMEPEWNKTTTFVARSLGTVGSVDTQTAQNSFSDLNPAWVMNGKD